MALKPIPSSPQPPHSMVVFVHGTLFGLPTLKTLLELGSEKKINITNLLKGEIYQDFLRKGRSRYFTHQAIQGVGLRKTPMFPPIVSPLSNPYKTKNVPATPSIASAFAHVTNNLPGSATDTFSFFTYGWSGKLDSKARRTWSESMYNEIFEEHERLKKIFGESTKLIILTHSHGGNVALNLAYSEQKFKRGLHVDKLLNFGAPVQSETEGYVDSPIFGKVYHIYSPGDVIQIADTISTQDFFSRRVLKKTSDKLLQMEINVDKTTPRHAELWFMGLSPIFYRPSLSIYPFPICVFSPLLIDAVEKKHAGAEHIKVKISQKDGHYVIRTQDKASSSVGSSTYKLSPEWNTFAATHTNLLQPHTKRQTSTIKKALYTAGIAALGIVIYNKVTSKKPPKK